jgi:hypothetical protein
MRDLHLALTNITRAADNTSNDMDRQLAKGTSTSSRKMDSPALPSMTPNTNEESDVIFKYNYTGTHKYRRARDARG